jgi:hypothetical protein
VFCTYLSIRNYNSYTSLNRLLPEQFSNYMLTTIIFLGIISLNGIFAVIFNWNLLRNKNEILETDLLDKQEGNLKLKLGWKFNTYFIFSLFILLLGLYGIRDLLIIIFVSVNQKILQVSYLIYITFIIFGITFLYDCFKIKRSFNSGQKFVQDQTKPTNVNRNPKLSKKSENPINSRSKPSKATNQNVPSELSNNHQTEKSLLAENKMSKRVEYQLEFTKIQLQGKIYDDCTRNTPEHKTSYLGQFMSTLYVEEIDGLIEEIEAAQNGLYFEEFPQSEGYEHCEVQIIPPNFLFGPSACLSDEIPLEDMRLLLLEWKEFKQS